MIGLEMGSALAVCGALRGPAFPVWVAISPAVLWQGNTVTPGAGARLGVAHVDPRCPYLPARPDATLGRMVAETRSDNPLLRFTGFCKQCTHTHTGRRRRPAGGAHAA